MNSMMLIPRPVYPRSTPALDAYTAARAHHRRVVAARRQHHPIARLQIDLAAFLLEAESDRALHAVENLFVGVDVRGVVEAGPVRPAVGAAGLGLQALQQLLPRHVHHHNRLMVKLRLRTSRREEALDVTEKVRRAVAASGVREGVCTAFAPHTTCAIAVNDGHAPAG